MVQNSFTDSVFRKAGKYTYEVEGIGFNNRKSVHRTAITVYRYQPNIHIIIDLKRKENGIAVSWKKPLNPHVSKLLLYKQFGNNKAVLYKTFDANKDMEFIDTNLQHGNTYLYSLKAKMVNGDKIVLNDGVEIGY